ncbi:UbiA family prenyltransferase [Variovorax sp. N23]|nr:UbiA family prenyltransferase [Variovorax sp. N23]
MVDNTPPPLVVDLDGTLVHTDMLHESTLRLCRQAPLAALRIPLWMMRGKAFSKQQIAQRTRLDTSLLPYDQTLLSWLHAQRQGGRQLVLCTASDRTIACDVAAHCQLFDEVLASDGGLNLKGEHKARALVQRFGSQGFDYVGDAMADLPVWSAARQGIVTNATQATIDRAQEAGHIAQVLSPRRTSLSSWWGALRVHHWTKNLLLFVALVAAHQIDDLQAWMRLALAFAAFSLCASSVYIANDLLDLEHDRRHPRKRDRPFASGALSIGQGVLLMPLLALAALALAWSVGPAFMVWLCGYLALTWLYSCWLKRLAVVDCLILAGLYMMRVVAGAAAVDVELSFWLLAFSGFLFLSLAFVKRYAELLLPEAAADSKLHGRGYVAADAASIQLFGVAAGYCAVLVLGLYLNSETVVRLYATPELVWGTVPVVLFWISWIWLRASRGEMHDDPLVFAFRDKASLVAAALFGMALVLGSWTFP